MVLEEEGNIVEAAPECETIEQNCATDGSSRIES